MQFEYEENEKKSCRGEGHETFIILEFKASFESLI